MSDIEILAFEFSCLVIPQMPVLEKKLIQVRWNLLCPRWFKLNTDGSALGYPGPVGGGDLIHDDHGRWVKGFLKIGRAHV